LDQFSLNSIHKSLLSKIEIDNQWLTINVQLRIKKSNATIEVFKGDHINFEAWQTSANSTHKIFEKDHHILTAFTL